MKRRSLDLSPAPTAETKREGLEFGRRVTSRAGEGVRGDASLVWRGK